MDRYAQILEKVDVLGNFEIPCLPHEGVALGKSVFRGYNLEGSKTTDFGQTKLRRGIISVKEIAT
jgi:hypothetical protein